MAISGTREARTQEIRLEEITEREESNFIKSLFPDSDDSLGGLGASGGGDFASEGAQASGNFLPTAGGTMIGAIAYFPKLIEIADDQINISKQLGSFSSRIIVNAEGAPTTDNLVTIFGAEHAGQFLNLQGTTGETITLVDMNGTQTAWVISTVYAVEDLVENGGIVYTCHTAHTSSASDEPGVGANWENFWHKANIMTVDGTDFSLVGEDNLFFVFDSVSNSWRQVTSGAQGVTGGANKSLSNLIATAINQDLLPNASDVLDLGNSTFYWSEIHGKSLKMHGTHATPITTDSTGVYKTSTGMDIHVTGASDIFKWLWNGASHYTFSPTQLNISGALLDNALGITLDNAGIDPIANGEFRLNSTDVKVFTGGVVKNLSDIGSGSGANTALSNLIATAINQDLLPDGSDTRDLGNSTFYWSEVHGKSLKMHGTHATPITTDSTGIYKTATGMDIHVTGGSDIIKYLWNGASSYTMSPTQFNLSGALLDNALGLTLNDFANPPIANGEMRLNGANVQIFSGGVVVDISDIPNKADTDLNNLVATSINQDLLPDGSDTRDLGNSTFYYSEIHGKSLKMHGTHATPITTDSTGVYKTATGMDLHVTNGGDIFKLLWNGASHVTISPTQLNLSGALVDNALGITLDDSAIDPIANGEIRLNGTAVKIMSGGVVVDIGGIVPITRGGTGNSANVRGDILYSPIANNWSRLPVGAVNTFLRADGVDVAYSTIQLSDLSDVTGKTGTGTVVVMDDTPTIKSANLNPGPTITSIGWNNANHNHNDANRGGQLVATTALTATGTKDATTFLRGDNTWAVPGGGSSPPFDDDVALVQDAIDNTRKLRIEVGGISASTTRVLTAPNHDGTIITDTNAQRYQNFFSITNIPGNNKCPGYSRDFGHKLRQHES
jgi:hypothetical protein